jgi:hypothetical protein
MRYLLVLLLSVTLFCPSPSGRAEDKEAAAKYEYAVVKWDGPDRLFYNLPDKFELVYLSKVGVQVPREAQSEEWCLAYAANKMAKEGWEALNLNSRRILFRRPK